MTKFENEYELYYKKAAADDDIEADDGVEEAFEALHRAAEAEQQLLYASRKFDTAVPRHALLDTSLNKNKSRPGHRQAARERGRQQVEEKKPVKVENSNMKIGSKILSTNAAREWSFKQKETSPSNPKKVFLLGIEPEVTRASKNILAENKQTLSQLNEYEDIRVFQKRKKRKSKNVDTSESVDQKSVSHKEEKLFTKREEVIPIASVNDVSNDDNSNLKSNEEANYSKNRRKTIKTQKIIPDGEEKKPFESFQNCLFTIFTSCVPWSCMRRVYWRREHRSEDIFTKTSRRNSREKFR